MGDSLSNNEIWHIPEEHQPIVIVQHSTIFRQRLVFRIREMRAATFLLTTKQNCDFLSSISLFTGIFEFPTIGTVEEFFQIIEISEQKDMDNGVLVKVDFISASFEFKELLGQFIFRFVKDVDVDILRKVGIKMKTIKQLVQYAYVEREEDLQQVIQLRKMAYGETEKVNDASIFFNDYDAQSKILIIKHQEKVIVSARLYFPQSNEDLLEHQQYRINFPKNFPENKSICEIMRVCTHPAYRKSDLLVGLFEFIGVTVIEHNRTFVLGCATKKLLPLYLKIGFEDMHLTYENPELNNVIHHLILMNVLNILTGKCMNPIAWNLIWGDMIRFLLTQKRLQITGLDLYRIKFYNALYPLTIKWK